MVSHVLRRSRSWNGLRNVLAAVISAAISRISTEMVSIRIAVRRNRPGMAMLTAKDKCHPA